MTTNHELLREKLITYVQDAHAMESQVLLMLAGLIETTHEATLKRALVRHHTETEHHLQRLQDRLEALDSSASLPKSGAAIGAAVGKGVLDLLRGDKPSQNGRDAFVTEHLEIAVYQLLERMAEAAGDPQTADVARRNRRDEEKMARLIARNWDRFFQLTLVEAGLAA